MKRIIHHFLDTMKSSVISNNERWIRRLRTCKIQRYVEYFNTRIMNSCISLPSEGKLMKILFAIIMIVIIIKVFGRINASTNALIKITIKQY